MMTTTLIEPKKRRLTCGPHTSAKGKLSFVRLEATRTIRSRVTDMKPGFHQIASYLELFQLVLDPLTNAYYHRT